MVAVLYEFYLTESGVELFDDWVALAASAMEHTNGFISAERLQRVDSFASCHMLARFDQEEDAWRWAMSSEHIRVLERLDGHHTRPWRTDTFHIRPIAHT